MKSKIILLGNNKEKAAEDLFKVLGSFFKVKLLDRKPGLFDLGEVLIIPLEPEELETSFIEKADKKILVLTHFEEYELGKLDFIKSKIDSFDLVIMDSDSKGLKSSIGKCKTEVLSFGFGEADFQAIEIKQEKGTNFKLSHRGSIIPFWLDEVADDKKIYSVLVCCAAAEALGINLLKVSETLKK